MDLQEEMSVRQSSASGAYDLLTLSDRVKLVSQHTSLGLIALGIRGSSVGV